MIDYEAWCRMKQYQQDKLNVGQIAQKMDLRSPHSRELATGKTLSTTETGSTKQQTRSL
ncbi:hypothetical protein [sulfur-oxidizing endosymbiont of Gigantopelta aegis]|uniref:hypothetical protein n=1 Tax=sulfur-oxidizing endosymbiont of Gigantopelta aegis TaxID=2794934 RepID=UPI0031B57DCA